MSELLKKIGRDIKKIRKQKKITQEQLANLIGTNKSNIARIESGNQNITIQLLSRIAQALEKKIQLRLQ
ncbi:MAG: helix-turn-helix domain-containing protein [Ignavibacteria bacterium]|nr:helix-turn-helix domain-containing protein [Ignavibacteria bacterium]